MKIVEIIYDELSKLLSENDVDLDIYEMMDDILYEVIREYKNALENGSGKQKWNVVPFPRLKKIWEDYIKYGVVRDTKGLDMIESIFTRNILKLNANTILAGHDSYFPDDEVNDHGLTRDDFWEGRENYDFFNFIEGYNGQPIISDYGLKPLFKLLQEVRKTHEYEKKLPILDKMLNIVHMRSDLASLLVQGGSNSLNKLSGYEDNPNLAQTQIHRPL